MATVLKQGRQATLGSADIGMEPGPLAFNAQDLEQRGREYLERVRAEAQAILESARLEAEQLKAQAVQDALQEAQQEFEQRVLEDAQRLSEQRCRSAVEACSATVSQLNRATAEWLSDWRDQTVELAARMAEKVIRREVTVDLAAILTNWLQEAMQRMQHARQVRVLVHPDDHALAGQFLRHLAKSAVHLPACEVVPDEAITPGGCIIQSADGQVDYQLETQLDRIREQLG